MATTFTLARPDVFNAGTVSVYAKTAAGVPASGAPAGSAVTTATATGAGVSFTGLADNTQYIAYQGSPDRYISFRTTPAAAAGGTETDPVAEADLATHAALTTAHGGIVHTESDPVAGAALTTHAALGLSAHGGLLASEFFDLRRSSEVSTMPRLLGVSATTALTSGSPVGTLAIARTAGSFTKIRFAVGAVAAATITAARVGAWALDGTLLADADISTLLGTINTLRDNVALSATVTLTAGQFVYLGFGINATTTPQMFGHTGIGAAKTLAPLLGRSASGYVSGTLPTLATASSSSTNHWLELVP